MKDVETAGDVNIQKFLTIKKNKIKALVIGEWKQISPTYYSPFYKEKYVIGREILLLNI